MPAGGPDLRDHPVVTGKDPGIQNFVAFPALQVDGGAIQCDEIGKRSFRYPARRTPSRLRTTGHDAVRTGPGLWTFPSLQQKPGRYRAGAGNIPACAALRRARCGCWNPSRRRAAARGQIVDTIEDPSPRLDSLSDKAPQRPRSQQDRRSPAKSSACNGSGTSFLKPRDWQAAIPPGAAPWPPEPRPLPGSARQDACAAGCRRQGQRLLQTVGITALSECGATPMTASSGRDLSASDASSCSFWKRSKVVAKADLSGSQWASVAAAELVMNRQMRKTDAGIGSSRHDAVRHSARLA